MAFVQFNKVSLAFGDRDILKEVSLNLAPGSRSALAGVNGSGKSTLMKVIAGKLTPDSGERAVQKGSRVAYLPQSVMTVQSAALEGTPALKTTRTLREEAETAYQAATAMLVSMDEIGRTLETATVDDSRTKGLLEEYHKLQGAVENSGYYHREQSIAMVLTGLGFSEGDMDRHVEEFSGGWQMRIALAKVLLEAPDILLLDEPTNYLDIEARSWLESWLRSFSGGYLLVSHDRYFLDVTITEVYELFNGSLKRYAGNYSTYEKVREAELEALLKRYAAQQEEIAKAEALINRFRYKATKAAMVQDRIKKLEKMEKIEIPESLKKISITFPPPPHSGRIALTLRGIGKCYGPQRVLAGLDLDLDSGERLLVVGRNGAGKSTLLRILSGADSNYEGSLQYGTGIAPGYFSQDAAETMTGMTPSGNTLSVLEYMEAEAPTALIPKVRDMLGAFLFRGDDVYKPIPVLSGGEKSRLALLRMLLKPMNLLILDEPTNHLDIYSKDILLKTLKSFTGTIIFVSHDRAFMEALSTKTLELAPHVPGSPAIARLFYGNYGYYLERHERESENTELTPSLGAGSAAASEQTVHISDMGSIAAPLQTDKTVETLPRTILVKASASTGAGFPEISGQDGPSGAEHRTLAKQRQTVIRRLERQEGEILKALETLEAEKAALETKLMQPEVYSSGEKARMVKHTLDDLSVAIDNKTREWEATAEELEQARSLPDFTR
jgi:ATP-binding cassette subfamily F protein 3